jgi:hypothetical protein
MVGLFDGIRGCLRRFPLEGRYGGSALSARGAPACGP